MLNTFTTSIIVLTSLFTYVICVYCLYISYPEIKPNYNGSTNKEILRLINYNVHHKQFKWTWKSNVCIYPNDIINHVPLNGNDIKYYYDEIVDESEEYNDLYENETRSMLLLLEEEEINEYNPTQRQYKINIDIGNGVNRQNDDEQIAESNDYDDIYDDMSESELYDIDIDEYEQEENEEYNDECINDNDEDSDIDELMKQFDNDDEEYISYSNIKPHYHSLINIYDPQENKEILRLINYNGHHKQFKWTWKSNMCIYTNDTRTVIYEGYMQNNIDDMDDLYEDEYYEEQGESEEHNDLYENRRRNLLLERQYKINRQNIQPFAAKTLNNNILNNYCIWLPFLSVLALMVYIWKHYMWYFLNIFTYIRSCTNFQVSSIWSFNIKLFILLSLISSTSTTPAPSMVSSMVPSTSPTCDSDCDACVFDVTMAPSLPPNITPTEPPSISLSIAPTQPPSMAPLITSIQPPSITPNVTRESYATVKKATTLQPTTALSISAMQQFSEMNVNDSISDPYTYAFVSSNNEIYKVYIMFVNRWINHLLQCIHNGMSYVISVFFIIMLLMSILKLCYFKPSVLFLIVVVISIISTECFEWNQLGSDIDGEGRYDESGYSVSLNRDGDRVAIGGHDTNGPPRHTRIYELNGSSWNQLGLGIYGEAANDMSAFQVSLNGDGDRVAIGAFGNNKYGSWTGQTRIYEWNTTSWTWNQLGSDIYGEAVATWSGFSVSLNSDGDRVAIGAIGPNGYSGHTRIYQWDTTSWNQLGLDIDGEAVGDQSGYSVSLNSDGDRVAIGASKNDGNGIDSGHTRIYEWNTTSWTWNQLGLDIDGEAGGDESGYSVSLNSDGDRVAIGARFNDGNGVKSGHTRIYEWNTTSWNQLGLDIDGEAGGDDSGSSVSLNEDGDRVAIGAVWNDGKGDKSGHTRIYEWNTTSWNQLGLDINGEKLDDWSGGSVSLNGDGDRVAIGARFNDGNGDKSGHTRIWQLRTPRPTNAPSISPTQPPSIAPSSAPTQPPSIAPSISPTQPPSIAPSISPTQAPSISPTRAPSMAPSIAPSLSPTLAPTQPPSLAPSLAPSTPPTNAPSDSSDSMADSNELNGEENESTESNGEENTKNVNQQVESVDSSEYDFDSEQKRPTATLRRTMRPTPRLIIQNKDSEKSGSGSAEDNVLI